MKTVRQKIKERFFNEYWPLWRLPLKFHSFWSDRSYLEFFYRKKLKRKIILTQDHSDLQLFTENESQKGGFWGRGR